MSTKLITLLSLLLLLLSMIFIVMSVIHLSLITIFLIFQLSVVYEYEIGREYIYTPHRGIKRYKNQCFVAFLLSCYTKLRYGLRGDPEWQIIITEVANSNPAFVKKLEKDCLIIITSSQLPLTCTSACLSCPHFLLHLLPITTQWSPVYYQWISEVL